MAHIDNLIKELQGQGIKAEKVDVVKNGVNCNGLRLKTSDNDSVCPVVYYTDYVSEDDIKKRIYDAVYGKRLQINIDVLTSWDYVKNHVYVGIQRQGKEDLVKRNFLNLELVIRVYLDSDRERGTVKVTDGFLKAIGEVTEDEIWERAIENSRALYRIRSMSSVLGLDDDGCDGLYVATSDNLIDAASVICYSEYFRQFCEDHDCNSCYILPSSTQEMLILPAGFSGRMEDVQMMADMVMDINRSQVDPLIQLDPCCYRYSIETDTVEIAAMAKED